VRVEADPFLKVKTQIYIHIGSGENSENQKEI
jgi:hypothetical protein